MGLFSKKKKASPSDLQNLFKEKGSGIVWSDIESLVPQKSAPRKAFCGEYSKQLKESILHTALQYKPSHAVIHEILQAFDYDDFIVAKDVNGDFVAHIAARNLEETPRSHNRNLSVLNAIHNFDPLIMTKRNQDGQYPVHVTMNALYQRLRSNATVDDPDTTVEVHLGVISWFFDTFPSLIDVKDKDLNTVWHHIIRIMTVIPNNIQPVASLLQKLVDKRKSASNKGQVEPWRVENRAHETPWIIFSKSSHMKFKQQRQLLGQILTRWEEEPSTWHAAAPTKIMSGTSSATTTPSTLSKPKKGSGGSSPPTDRHVDLNEESQLILAEEVNGGAGTESGPPTSIYGNSSSFDSSSRGTMSSLMTFGTAGMSRKLSQNLSPELLASLPNPNRPYDVFLLHAGENKYETAGNLVEYLNMAGFECFLDKEMRQGRGAPTHQMRWALETCRHVVVLISHDFVLKKHPCAELDYAFKRAEWFQSRYNWRSLQIILYQMTVEEYSDARKDSERPNHLAPLPLLEKSQVMKEFGIKGQKQTFPEFSKALVEEMITHDNETAGTDWKSFLQSFSILCDAGFPRANHLYA